MWCCEVMFQLFAILDQGKAGVRYVLPYEVSSRNLLSSQKQSDRFNNVKFPARLLERKEVAFLIDSKARITQYLSGFSI